MFGIDDALIGAGIGALGSWLGGKQAAQGAQEQQATSAQMAKDQMAFQERMSNTAYQRGVADIRASGLNPGILYGSASAASSPSGAMGVAQNVRGAGVNSAMAAAQMASSLADSRASRGVAASQVALNSAAAAKASAEAFSTTGDYHARFDRGDDGRGGFSPSYQEQWNRLTLEAMRKSLELTTASTRATTARSVLDELGQSRARRESQMYGSDFGKFVPFVDSVGKAINFFRP